MGADGFMTRYMMVGAATGGCGARWDRTPHLLPLAGLQQRRAGQTRAVRADITAHGARQAITL